MLANSIISKFIERRIFLKHCVPVEYATYSSMHKTYSGSTFISNHLFFGVEIRPNEKKYRVFEK
mgnify:CR=1 FL=1